MTKFGEMKIHLCSDITKMDERQFYNLLLLLEKEQDAEAKYGVRTDEYYNCNQCETENNCYKSFVEFCNKEEN